MGKNKVRIKKGKGERVYTVFYFYCVRTVVRVVWDRVTFDRISQEAGLNIILNIILNIYPGGCRYSYTSY